MTNPEARLERAPPSSFFAVVTVSDTRTKEDDETGTWLKDQLERNGHIVTTYSVVGEDITAVRTAVQTLVHGGPLDVMITVGSTGLSQRDCVPEALGPLLERRIDGFGELFRFLSYQEVGAAAMFSRAFAGVIANSVIFCLPGSHSAAKLALSRLILPDLGHLLAMFKAKPTLPP